MTGPFADADLFADAPCVGRHVLCDPHEPGEDPRDLARRLQAAVSLCSRCPVRDPCAGLLATLPQLHQAGVWAGRWWVRGRARPLPQPTTDNQETA